MLQPLSSQSAVGRYQALRQQIERECPSRGSGDHFVGNHLEAPPPSPEFSESKIYLGSHIDRDPATADRIYLISARPLGNGTEELFEETFVEAPRTRGLGDWIRGTAPSTLLYHYAFVSHRAAAGHGPTGLAAALGIYDTRTGETLDALTDREAVDRAWKDGVAR